MSQTITEIAPLQVRDASELAAAYTQVGRNDAIGLSGRPLRQLRTLSTSRLYVLAGESLLFLPQFMSQKGFYLALDNQLIVKRLKTELAYISQNWDSPMRPLLVIKIQRNMLKDGDQQVLLDFLREITQGDVQGTPVTLGLLTDFVATAAYEKIGYLHDFRFSEASWQPVQRPFEHVLPLDSQSVAPPDSRRVAQLETLDDAGLIRILTSEPNIYWQLEALTVLLQRYWLDYDLGLGGFGVPPCCRLRDLLEEVYTRAGDRHNWYVVRRCAGLLGKYDIDLEQAATEILVRQHGLTVGRAYSGKATLRRPTDSWQILEAIRTFNPGDVSQQILIQELILYLGLLIKREPSLFADMNTIRVGHVLDLIIAGHKRQTHSTLDEAFSRILAMAPSKVAVLVRETLMNYSESQDRLCQVEALHQEGQPGDLASARFQSQMNPPDYGGAGDWYAWREQQGSVGRESDSFFSGVWQLLHHCKGLMIGEKYNSKRRIDSENILAQMTAGEHSFRLYVNHMLDKIQSPVHRQLTVEALRALMFIVRENPSLLINDTLVVDILLGHAVRINWRTLHSGHVYEYEENVALAWQSFYQLPPNIVANCILDALIHLLTHESEQQGGAS